MAETSKPKTKKTAPKKAAAKEPEKQESKRFWEATGRRKTAVARVRLKKSKHPSFSVNTKPLEQYFQDPEFRTIAKEALNRGAGDTAFEVSALVRGGGMHAQAVAVRHGVARALIEQNESLRGTLKTLGFLTRDPRMRERKKFGLRRARRARQWRKR